MGLTANSISAVFTTQRVLIILFKPGVGYLADYINKIKAIMISEIVLMAVFYLFTVTIPSSGMPGIKSLQVSDLSQCRFALS